jgi:O-antigen biosynthesis protein
VSKSASIRRVLVSLFYFLCPVTQWKKYGLSSTVHTYLLQSYVPRGWYVLSVLYRGSDLRTFVRFRACRGGFTQAINVRPCVRRVRVIRINHVCQPLLEFESDDPGLQAIRLRLRRVPSVQAWGLIIKKLKQRHPIYGASKSIPTSATAWRDYNRLQHGRFHPSPLATYVDWIRLVEPRLSCSLPSLSLNSEKSNASTIFWYAHEGEGSFDPAPSGTWVITTVPHQINARQAEKQLSSVIEANPACKLISTDFDRISIAGTRYSPNFKPAFNIDLAFSDPMYAIGTVMSADLWNQVLSRLSTYSSTHTVYGMFLEAITSVSSRQFIHLPQILFHLSDPLDVNEYKTICLRASDKSLSTVKAFFENHELEVKVGVQLRNGGRWGQQVTWTLPQRSVLVSILLPTRDSYPLLSACIASLFSISAGIEFELIIIDNGSEDRDALILLEELSQRQNISVIRDSGPFNYSALINKGARLASGEVLCLLNNDTEVIAENWLSILSSYAMRPDIGCVGPMLLYADNTVQHGGVVLGIGGIAGHAHKYLASDSSGYQARLQLCQNFSAVTGACLVVRSALWRSLEGLDEDNLAVNYNDVDFCLRATAAGFRNLYVPQVKLYHYESKSRGSPSGFALQQWQKERMFMLRRWGDLIENDPAYSPHLSLSHEDFSLSLSVDNIAPRSCSMPVDIYPKF